MTWAYYLGMSLGDPSKTAAFMLVFLCNHKTPWYPPPPPQEKRRPPPPKWWLFCWFPFKTTNHLGTPQNGRVSRSSPKAPPVLAADSYCQAVDKLRPLGVGPVVFCRWNRVGGKVARIESFGLFFDFVSPSTLELSVPFSRAVRASGHERKLESGC